MANLLQKDDGRVSQNATNAHRWRYSLHQGKTGPHVFPVTPPNFFSHMYLQNDMLLENVSDIYLLFQMMASFLGALSIHQIAGGW